VKDAKFDAVETLNASAFPFNRCKRKATEVAQKLKLPCVGGTDAHYGPTIGYGCTAIDSESTVDAIVQAIVSGNCKPFGQPVPLTLTLERQYKLMKRTISRVERRQ
jgi:predicted metal-dependent phosphoesterase TrpH